MTKLEFKYFYNNATELLQDFVKYKQETQTNPTQSDKQISDNAKTMANNVRDI